MENRAPGPLAWHAIARAFGDGRFGQQTEAIGDAVGVVQMGALVVGIQDVQVIKADRAERLDIALRHLAGPQRQLFYVPRQSSIWPRQRRVVSPIEGLNQCSAVVVGVVAQDGSGAPARSYFANREVTRPGTPSTRSVARGIAGSGSADSSSQ